MDLTYIAKRAGRLSSVLKEDMHLSTGLMNRLKWADRILVNGSPVHTDYPVQAGDTVTCLLDEPEPEYPGEEGNLRILYEDAYLLAVDKPAGMLIHPSRQRNTGTLANLVVGYYGKKGEKSAFHPITRLDRDTFGVVLIAKNSHIHGLLGSLMEAGEIHKTYEALCFGVFPGKEGVIDAPIARRELPSLLRFVSDEGKPSVTEYRVLEEKNGITRVALHPVTGRTHQLRVHCAYIGCPILGDPQYGSEESQGYSLEKGIGSQLLCAGKLEFPHPMTGLPMVIKSMEKVEIL